MRKELHWLLDHLVMELCPVEELRMMERGQDEGESKIGNVVKIIRQRTLGSAPDQSPLPVPVIHWLVAELDCKGMEFVLKKALDYGLGCDEVWLICTRC